MAVYVDPLFNTEGWSDKWPYKQACHCWADTLEELHDFCVNKLHMKRSWFQDKPFFPHYDLTAGTRRRAIKLGALPMSDTAAVEHRRKLQEEAEKLRGNKQYGTPISELSGRPGHKGFEEFKRISQSWGYE